ncbi:hypothetical protein IPC325_23220 [Pseudomonas aeruginosa]|uniref:hypothetical protein n=1 Tax=Pseudomonas aeruginosa TaxID=287 RepID=UPI000FC4142D|nr:hypothetical protein [Pseudomonas aeruginosa]RUJ73832.1 hypothetical protein IPC325_23220 [Pseudomonas aeruginosa]
MNRNHTPQLSDTVEGVLYGWKHQAGQSPSSGTFARICPGPTFTILSDGKMHKVVDTISTVEATLHDEQDLRDAISAGQVEIYRLVRGAKRKVLMHAATGNPLKSGGEA